MCTRYVSPAAESIVEDFKLGPIDWRFPANFNTAPLQAVPAIRAMEGKSAAALLRWGLGRSRARTVRVESVATGAGRSSWKRGRRCIIPALGFYEWHVNSDGTKQPFYVHVDDQDVFGFAGLWEPSGEDANTVTESCALVSLPANALVSEIHNSRGRMPAILAREQRELWLFGNASAAGEALAAYASERMIAYAVSGRVDSPENNDETLLEPLQTDVD
jgi:putative SOS response-associated peptidase YedK